MDSFVELKQHAPFAKGGNRACYVDPRDSDRCIKVLLPERSPEMKRRAARGLKRLRPLYYYDDNLRELQSYERIEAFAGEAAWAHLPKCAGLVQTDCGRAIVTELIRDHDGGISVDVKAYLRACGNDPAFRAAVEEFCLYLKMVAVPTRDILLHNLVARRIHANGAVRLYLIDGFGTSDLIPFVYWLPKLAKLKALRKIVRFKAKIEDFLQKYDIPFYE
jgi:hypothetical protein